MRPQKYQINNKSCPTWFWSEHAVRQNVVVDETDDLHVAGGQGQRPRCVAIVSFSVDIHALGNSKMINNDTWIQ